MIRNRKRSPLQEVTALEDRTVPAFFSTLYNPTTTTHLDLSTSYFNSVWTTNFIDQTSTTLLGQSSSALTDSAVYVPASKFVTTPSGTSFSFIGATSAYILNNPVSSTTRYLDVSATANSFPSYRPTDSRVSSSQPWVRFDLQAARGPGKVSVYTTSTSGVPTNWIATNDGVSAKDVLYVAAGADNSYNWAFTAPGVYELDFTATGYLATNKTNPTTSETFTVYFSVDPPAPKNTVPVAGANSTGGAAVKFSSAANTISITGSTTAPAPISTTVTAKSGTINLGTTSNVGLVSGNGSSSVTVVGTIAEVNTALNGMTYTPNANFNGVDTFTVLTTDNGEYKPTPNNEQTDTDSFGIVVSGNTSTGTGTSPPTTVVPPTYPLGSPQAAKRYMAIGSQIGQPNSVSVIDTETLGTVSTFSPYNAAFTGGVRTSVADFLKIGVPDVVVGAASAGGPHIQVINMVTGRPRLSFFAFDPSFTGGVSLAVADFNGDTVPDIVVGAGAGGGPHVRIFDGITGAVIRNTFAFEPTFRGGVSVAAGDVNGDGSSDLVVGAGAGGGPAVAVFDGTNFASVKRFFAYAPTFTGGVNVTVGNVTGTTAAEIIVGAGPGGGPHVQVLSGSTFESIASFFAVPVTPQDNRGVQVTVQDFNRDLVPEIVTATSQSSIGQAKLRSFTINPENSRAVGTDLSFSDSFNGAIYVGGLV
jgi:surface-anchored protein